MLTHTQTVMCLVAQQADRLCCICTFWPVSLSRTHTHGKSVCFVTISYKPPTWSGEQWFVCVEGDKSCCLTSAFLFFFLSFVHVWFVFFIAAVLSLSLFLFKVLSHLNFSPHKRFFSGSSRTSLCKGGECVQREPIKSLWGVFVHTFTPIKGTSKHVQIARRPQCSNFFFLLLLLSFFSLF